MSADHPPEHPGIARFRSALAAADGSGRIVVLPESAHTAALAAAALGCEVGAIANSLLFTADGSPVLVLTSGSHRVDERHVASIIGVHRLKRASAETVREATGQVIGGVSPLGHPAPLPTYLDRSLVAYPEIWAAAGHPASVFSTTYAELLRMTGAIELSVRPDDGVDPTPAQGRIWANPDCSKCQTALASLPPSIEVRWYLAQAPSELELRDVVGRLGIPVWELARPDEAAAAGIDLPRDSAATDRWFAALAAHPAAIQRPIVMLPDGSAHLVRDPAALDRAVAALADPPTS